MADDQSQESVRREIAFERERLATAVDSLRDAAKIKVNVPVLAAAAVGVGFVLAGGIGATVRLIFRRGREHHED
ncbi:MAG: DUF3618 domain-containing protein [Actinobacteria bacterium]|nr:DUF3618 domain-containing protein [Actinomycetota bacterium]